MIHRRLLSPQSSHVKFISFIQQARLKKQFNTAQKCHMKSYSSRGIEAKKSIIHESLNTNPIFSPRIKQGEMNYENCKMLFNSSFM